jgi:hypothetical protein
MFDNLFPNFRQNEIVPYVRVSRLVMQHCWSLHSNQGEKITLILFTVCNNFVIGGHKCSSL